MGITTQLEGLSVGDVVMVRFLDHVSCDDSLDTTPFMCKAWGEVTALEDEYIVLRSWETEGADCQDSYHIILRQVIRECISYKK